MEVCIFDIRSNCGGGTLPDSSPKIHRGPSAIHFQLIPRSTGGPSHITLEQRLSLEAGQEIHCVMQPPALGLGEVLTTPHRKKL
jgi:hypothetical protein